MRKDLEVSGKLPTFAAEIPPCMQITWVKLPSGGFIFNYDYGEEEGYRLCGWIQFLLWLEKRWCQLETYVLAGCRKIL
jgi:hypothetical protein